MLVWSFEKMWPAYCKIVYVTNKNWRKCISILTKRYAYAYVSIFCQFFFYAAIIKFGNSEDIARLVYILINTISMYLYIKALITDINYHGIY